MKHWALFLLLGAIATANLMAQVMGGTPTTGSGGQTSVQANPNLGSGGGALGPNTASPVYVSGKVVMEDGSPVAPNVTIERVCSGMSKTVAYTDSKGRFNFQWGDRSMTVTDASDAGSSGHSNTAGFGSSQSAGGANTLAADPFGSRMMNCALRASMAGYTSDNVDLFNRRTSENSDIGTIVLHRIAGVEGSSISVTSMMAPKDAKKAYEHGLQSLLKNKPDDAAKDFEKAVGIYPKYADAWVSLGKLRLDRQSIEPARAALMKAMEADPKLVAPYMELGLLAAKDANWQDSGKYLDRAVELDPVDFPQGWYADAVANYNLRKYDAAEKSAREAVKLDQRHVNPRAGYLLGLVLAEKKDYAGAAAELTAYIKLAPNAPDLALVKDQLSQLEKLMGAPK
ncbi:MAG: tetratricopeptide repeat protein [Bryobacteraceae bacterium]